MEPILVPLSLNKYHFEEYIIAAMRVARENMLFFLFFIIFLWRLDESVVVGTSIT